MLKNLKSFQTINPSRPSKKALMSPEATTHIDCNEIFETLLKDLDQEMEDLGTEIYDQLAANRSLCIEIMKESLDAELTYSYINCVIGRGILVGIILTLVGQRTLQAEIQELEAKEADSDDDYGA